MSVKQKKTKKWMEDHRTFCSPFPRIFLATINKRQV